MLNMAIYDFYIFICFIIREINMIIIILKYLLLKTTNEKFNKKKVLSNYYNRF